MKKSKLWKLDIPDYIKAGFMAVLGAVVAMIYDMVYNGVYPVTTEAWITIGKGALLALVTYIVKQLSTNSDGKILKKEPPVK